MPHDTKIESASVQDGTSHRPAPMPVSVVIPTYNRAGVILDAIRSVLDQCRSCDEVIVVDDGSTDDTESVISVLRDQITYLRVPNGGAGRARNIGIDGAKNDLVAFLDSDDRWVPGKLELQRALFRKRPEIVLCTTDLTLRYPPGGEEGRPGRIPFPYPGFLERMAGPSIPYTRISRSPEGVPDFQVFIGDLYRAQLQIPCIAADTVMINRGRVGDVLRFPEDVPYHEDFECFSRVAKVGPSAFLDWEGAVMYMDFGPQMTHMNVPIMLGATLKVIERVWGQDPTFLADHGGEYRGTLDSLRKLRVWELISQGDMREARRELSLLDNAPLGYRWMSHLPGALASRLIWRCFSHPAG
jgi:GT2 family glycosyltransferase